MHLSEHGINEKCNDCVTQFLPSTIPFPSRKKTIENAGNNEEFDGNIIRNKY